MVSTAIKWQRLDVSGILGTRGLRFSNRPRKWLFLLNLHLRCNSNPFKQLQDPCNPLLRPNRSRKRLSQLNHPLLHSSLSRHLRLSKWRPRHKPHWSRCKASTIFCSNFWPQIRLGHLRRRLNPMLNTK